MSRKLKAFRLATLMPQVSCNYQIMIPSISRSLIAIESATLPFKKTQSASIYVRGIEYKVPVKQTAQSQWSCTMPENMFMSTLYQSLNEWYRSMGGDAEMFYTFQLGRIYIYITDALTGNAPVAQCVLDDCYLTEIRDINLSAGGANEIIKVQLTFQYNDILDPIQTLEGYVNSVTGGTNNVIDGGIDSVLSIQAGVAASTTAAWTAAKAEKLVRDKLNINDILGGVM